MATLLCATSRFRVETDARNERLPFVQDVQSDRFTMAELCARHGVSRPTGCKWITR